jgi:hypothetical protein
MDNQGQGQWSDVWKFSKIATSISEYSKKSFLAYNFPNPFSESTVIHFEVKSKKHVLIDVVDIFGKKISFLMDKVLEKGEYDLYLNGLTLKMGIYVCRIRQGEVCKYLKIIKI